MAAEVQQYVKGQDEAIQKIATAFFHHGYSYHNHINLPVKSYPLLVGPTGVGKDEICKRFGELCGCPVVHINSSEITATGWYGSSFEEKLQAKTAGIPFQKLKYAIIVFDEFDKIPHYGRDSGSSGAKAGQFDMMRDIMRLLDDETVLQFDDMFDDDEDTITKMLPVKNLLIVFTGAFSGMETIIKKRLEEDAWNTDGKNIEVEFQEGEDVLCKMTKRDLEKWGFLPELLGRIGNICCLRPLSADDIFLIMQTAKDNAVKRQEDFCKEYYNIDLKFSEESLRYMASVAEKSGLGCRNVKNLVAGVMTDFFYSLPIVAERTQHPREVTIDIDYVRERLKENDSAPKKTTVVRQLGFRQQKSIN